MKQWYKVITKAGHQQKRNNLEKTVYVFADNIANLFGILKGLPSTKKQIKGALSIRVLKEYEVAMVESYINSEANPRKYTLDEIKKRGWFIRNYF